MKTDKLFYQIFLTQPQLIRELIPTIPANCEFTYSAPVVKEKELRLDGLLEPVGEDTNLPLIFLEAQMQPDSQFYSRYFASIFLYLHQYKITRPWQGLLIIKNRNLDLGSTVPYQLLLENQVTIIYLEDLLPLTDLSPSLALLKLLVVTQKETATSLAKSILETVEGQTEFQKQFDLIEAILKSKFPKLRTEEVLKMFDLKTATMPPEPELYNAFVNEVKRDGESEVIIRQLNRRCGNLSESLIAQVRSLSIPQLEALGEALLDFTGINDLETWLNQDIE
jgi:predicted transposase/invertase (TIGR01784 family)